MTRRRVSPLDGTSTDLRRAVRSLAASPAIALGIMASLALGIGANIAAFSLIQTLFVRPFPHVAAQDQLVNVCVGAQGCALSQDEYQVLRREVAGWADLAAAHPAKVGITTAHRSESRQAALVSSNYFRVLGVSPTRGRFFVDTDEQDGPSHPVAVISTRLWRTGFAGAPDVPRRIVQINGADVQVIGIVPEGFVGTRKGRYDTDVWLPLSLGDLVLQDDTGRGWKTVGVSYRFDVIARPHPEIGRDELRDRLQSVALARNVALPLSETDASSRSEQSTVISLDDVGLNDLSTNAIGVAVFSAVPALVLLIACVNAALLLMARAGRNTREWHLRVALGAAKRQIARHVLLEAGVLSAAAALAGLLVAGAILRWQEQFIPLPVPIDWQVMVFTIGMAAFVTAAFGCAPAWSVAGRAIALSPRLGIHRVRSRVRNALILLQAMLSIALLITGAQFLRTIHGMVGASGLSDANRVAIITVDVSKLDYAESQIEEFFTKLLTGTRLTAGVSNAGLSTDNYWGGAGVETESARVLLPGGETDRARDVLFSAIRGDLLGTVDLQIVSGRSFSEDDAAGHPRAVLVNEAFERSIVRRPALGTTIHMVHSRTRGPGRAPMEREPTEVEVVGVVRTTGTRRTDSVERPHIYYPAPIDRDAVRHLYLKHDGTTQWADDVRGLVTSLDERVPLEITTVRESIERDRIEDRWIAESLAAVGSLGLILAAGGLFGIVTHVVSMRTRELGVRLALGASRRQVLLLVWRQAMDPVVVGLVVGSGVAVALGLVVRSRLYGSSPVDPVAVAAAAGLLLASMTVASLLPAVRASRIDPAATLKSET